MKLGGLMDLGTHIQTELKSYATQKYFESIPSARELSPQQQKDHIAAGKVADIGLIVCMAIFSVCLVVVLVLISLALPVAIMAIPSAIGVLVFLVPAISRIINLSLEYQDKKATDTRRIENTIRKREGDLLKYARSTSFYEKCKVEFTSLDIKDLQIAVDNYFPWLTAKVTENEIQFIEKKYNK